MATVMWMVVLYMTTGTTVLLTQPIGEGAIFPTQIACDAEGHAQVADLAASAGPMSVATFSYTCDQVIVVQ